MGWFRFDDKAIDHPKFLALSDGAFRLWFEGGAYCNRHLTDGLILREALNGFRYTSRKRVDELVKEGLWDVDSAGFRLHDYHEWNDSKETVLNKKRLAAHRRAFQDDKGLKAALRARDKDACRYCGRPVNWADRKSALGATYDHVDPKGPATMENLVIACRGCNSSKRDRTPAAAGMTIRPVPNQVQNQTHDLGQTTGLTSGVVRRSDLPERRSEDRSENRLDPFTDETVTERAGRFVERYELLYKQHRGANYLVRPGRDYQSAVGLCATWDDDSRLDKIASIFLTTDNEFAEKGSRTIPQFAGLASWCDGKLTEWERRQK